MVKMEFQYGPHRITVEAETVEEVLEKLDQIEAAVEARVKAKRDSDSVGFRA